MTATEETPLPDWIAAGSAHVAAASPVEIAVGDGLRVSGLLAVPPSASACFVFAHGAGAGMTHPFMTAVAGLLFKRGIATLRYQFPFMQQGGKRPDPPKLAQATVRAAVAKAGEVVPAMPLIAGGKSFGGRMTSQAQARAPLSDVRGLAFLGFPLHQAGKPSQDRARHLFDVHVPMLFLQGTRDALADVALLEPLCTSLGARATLHLLPDADHSFRVSARSGRTAAEVLEAAAHAFSAWASNITA